MDVGFVNCETCGRQIITDPKSVTIWFNVDASEQLIEVKCPSCKKTRQGRIGTEEFEKFIGHPINVVPLHKKFGPLTETAIENWDMDKEFVNEFAKLI